MPMYEALLSKPDMDKKTRVTLKYKNGSIIYQVKGEEQVKIIISYIKSACEKLPELALPESLRDKERSCVTCYDIAT